MLPGIPDKREREFHQIRGTYLGMWLAWVDTHSPGINTNKDGNGLEYW